MRLQLVDMKLVNLTFNIIERDSKIRDNEDNLNLSVGQFYNEDDEFQFGVGFKIMFTRDGYYLNLEMRYFFRSDEPITEDFKKSSFPFINAPAIAFPYLRSFITNLTMQSGYPPIIIPSINFVELARAKSE